MRRISPATIIATVALIFAVTGTATAAGLINGSALKGNSVTSAKIRNGSLQSKDSAPPPHPAAADRPAGNEGRQGRQG